MIIKFKTESLEWVDILMKYHLMFQKTYNFLNR